MTELKKPFLKGETDRDKLWELKRAVDRIVEDANIALAETQMQIDALEARIRELEEKQNG